MAGKRFDPKAKERRKKQFAGVGGALLVVLLAIQGPKTLRLLKPAGAAPSASTTPGTASPGTARSAAPATAAAANGGALTDSDRGPAALPGQLVSFALFTSKDPFVPQVRAAAPGAGSSPGRATPAAVPRQREAGPPTTGERTPSAPPARRSRFTRAARRNAGESRSSARIAVNGVAQTVRVTQEFPARDPIFRLVSATGDSAEIAIVGGSYDSGAKTVTLERGEPLTLMNTADRRRYELRLL